MRSKHMVPNWIAFAMNGLLPLQQAIMNFSILLQEFRQLQRYYEAGYADWHGGQSTKRPSYD